MARVARRRIRALIAARQSAAAIEVEIGQTLLALVDRDLTYTAVFELVGISRHHGRRFIDVARAPQAPPGAGPIHSCARRTGDGPEADRP